MIHRAAHDADFTVLDNHHFRNTELSLKAKGLLSLMLSLPDDWQFNIAGLVALSKDGRDSVMVGLRELEEQHYIKRKRSFGDRRKFAGYSYEVFERPYTDFPTTDNGDVSGKKKSRKVTLTTEDFDRFWAAYPRKQAKGDAVKAWAKVAAPLDVILDALERQKRCRQWRKENGQYIPLPASWLRGQRWLDEIEDGGAEKDGTDKQNWIAAGRKLD